MLRPGDHNDARDPLSATANRRRPLPGQSGWTPALGRTSGTSSRPCLSACERQPTTNTTRRAGGAAQAKQYPDDRATTACAGEGEDDRRRRRRPAPAHRRRVRNHRADRVAGLAPDRTSCLRLRQDQDCPFPTEQHSHCSSTVRPLRATSIGADGCSTLLVPPGDAKDEGLGRRRSRCGSRPALAPARYFKPLRAETS